jgi:hypothetical protein
LCVRRQCSSDLSWLVEVRQGERGNTPTSPAHGAGHSSTGQPQRGQRRGCWSRSTVGGQWPRRSVALQVLVRELRIGALDAGRRIGAQRGGSDAAEFAGVAVSACDYRLPPAASWLRASPQPNPRQTPPRPSRPILARVAADSANGRSDARLRQPRGLKHGRWRRARILRRRRRAHLVFRGDSNAQCDPLDRNPESLGELLDGFAILLAAVPRPPGQVRKPTDNQSPTGRPWHGRTTWTIHGPVDSSSVRRECCR